MAAVPTPEALGIAFAHACGFAPRYGLEQLEIACRVIAEQAAPELRESLGQHLPSALARLLAPRAACPIR